MVEQSDWTEGIGLEDLITWLNQVAARFRPDSVDEKARASREFSPRTFRHYQTLGCVDAPLRAGKSVRYGFRHYLQGLLLRKLLWERVPSEQIVDLMAGRTEEEYKRLLFEGIEVIPKRRGRKTGGGKGKRKAPMKEVSWWSRHHLADGVELELREGRPELTATEAANLIEAVRVLVEGGRGGGGG